MRWSQLKKITNISLLLITTVQCNDGQHVSLLVVDTSLDSAYHSRSMLTLANSVGFTTEHRQFYELEGLDLAPYDAIFLQLNGSFMAHWHHPIVRKLVATLQPFTQTPGKLFGLLLPKHSSYSSSMGTLTARIIKEFYTLHADHQANLAAIIGSFIPNLLQSDVCRSCDYDTSLFKPHLRPHVSTSHPISDRYQRPFKMLYHDQHPIAALLPQADAKVSATALRTAPFGLFVKGKDTADLFISKQGLLSFADIEENFRLNPINIHLKEELLRLVQTTFAELHTLITSNKKVLAPSLLPALPQELTQQHMLAEKQRAHQERALHLNQQLYGWIEREGLFAGWLDVLPYTKSKTALHEGIASIVDAHLNMLWFTHNPEMFLSNRSTRKDTHNYFDQIKTVNTALKKTYEHQGHKAPHIFINMDITSNINANNIGATTKDMFDHNYTKIPAPLDIHDIWEREVLSVFDAFADRWHTDIGAGLPIGGVLFDFEMYHAQDQLGEYPKNVDFSDIAWQAYIQATDTYQLRALTTTTERVAHLLNTGTLKQYFAVLQQEAQKLGKKIKERIRQKAPHAIMAAYNMTLPHSWFYLGIMAGLSSPEEPLILATFNNDFYSHYQWLKQHHVYAYHMPAIPLSKFRKPEHFAVMHELGRYNDGVWFGRFSKMLERPADKNFGIENSPLPTKMITQAMSRYFTQQAQQK